MPITKTTQITNSEAIKLIEAAKNAELCRDIRTSRRILSAIWEDLDNNPKLDGLEFTIQAEILRLCGFFLSFYGRSKNLKNYQERGRNFLTKAIEMFDCEKLPHKSAEAKVMLSLCYWYEGAIAESELILSETESEYINNRIHPVYIQICVNRLGIHYWKQELKHASELIEKLSVSIELCEDARLKAMYHNQAGIIYRLLKQTDKAIFNFNEAIKNARQSSNGRFCAINFNNLGNVCKDIGKFAEAHKYVDEALNFYTELQETGWLAHVLDTKAQIYFAENKLTTALIKINESLKIFRESEDFAGLVESLSTKCKILLKLGKVSEAVMLLAELVETAKARIGEFAAKKYADEFAKLIYPLENTSYPNEVKAFKASLLRKHLTDADLQITKAAQTLGISHQSLSDILNNQFPELYIELGLRRRLRRNGKRREFLSNIAPVKLTDSQMSYDGELKLNEESSYYTFALSGKRLPSLKTKQNVVVLIEAGEEEAGETVIMQNQKTDEFHCGVLEIDNLTGIFYLNDSSAGKDAFPSLLDDFKYYGKVVGYCLLEEDSGTRILFRPF
ncbi:MAG TPA: tetratricopeptide repeat protein [Pyrinomonadaceae bacterium]|nr:tetratricopeptide repeat protein [Pyrinomonadaceae bacterium]